MTTSNLFNNAVVIVTGAGRGIGKNIARAFGSQGAQVIIGDTNPETGRKTQAELAGQDLNVDFLQIDLSRSGEPQQMVKTVVERYGRLDILVNNARAGKRTALLDETEDNWDETMSVALKAAFFASQEAIRSMALTGGGNIVNISSVAMEFVCHESPVYHIAKAGLLQMTRYLAVHAGPSKVRVNAVAPGFIVKDEHLSRYQEDDNRHYRFISEFSHPGGSVGSADEVTAAVLFLCSPQATFVTGQCITVDGGMTLQDPSSLLHRFGK